MLRPALIAVLAASVITPATFARDAAERFTAINMDTPPHVSYGNQTPDRRPDTLSAVPAVLTAFVNADRAPEGFE